MGEAGSERRYGPRHLILAGVLGAILYYVMASLLGVRGGELLGWGAAVALTAAMYLRGLDVNRIRYSMTMSFIEMVSYMYVALILLLNLEGAPRVVAILLTPLVAGHAAAYLHGLFESRGARGRVRVPLAKRVRSTLFELDPLMIAFLSVGSMILVVFLVVPVAMMLWNAFITPPGSPFYENFLRIFTGKSYVSPTTYGDTAWSWQDRGGLRVLVVTGVNYGILLNSLINSAIVTGVATILGVAVAFVVARYDFPGRTFIRLFAILPLFVTPFINTYVIKLLFGVTGPLSWITMRLFDFAVEIRDLAGVTVAQIMAFYPIVYLNAYSAFINIDPSMEEQAENLGSRGLKLFSSVTLPLALPGIAAGSIIVFIFSLEDLGAPIVFQERRLMSYQIYSSFTSQTGIVSPEIAALGFVMLALAVAGFLLVRNYVGMRSYAMISRGGRWHKRERRLGLKGLLAVYLILLPIIVWTAMPQIGVILLAFNIMPPTGFLVNLDNASPRYFFELFTNPNIFMYVRNTVTYALTAVAFAVALSVIIGYAVSRSRIRIVTPALDALATVPIAIPGLVVALGYFYFFSSGFFSDTPLDPTMGPTLFQAWIVLIIAYTIRKLPFVVRSVYAGFQQVHVGLEEAALNLGATRRRTVFGIVLPLIITYIISGAVIGFIYISTEVSTSVTIGSLRPDQAPMTFYMKNIYIGGQLAGIQYVAAMGVLLILFQMLAIIIVIVGLKQSYAFIGA